MVNRPSQDRLKELFNYAPEGFFVRKIRTGSTTHVGQEVRGSLRPDGYRTLWVDGSSHYFHRCIFAWHNGFWPPLVDHKDRDNSNNRICNLRELSPEDSTHNTSLRFDNSTGFKGVYRNNNGNIIARPTRKGKRIWLGVFDTPEEAAKKIKEYDLGLAC